MGLNAESEAIGENVFPWNCLGASAVTPRCPQGGVDLNWSVKLRVDLILCRISDWS